MKFRTPFNWLSVSEQTRAFVAMFVLTIVVMATLQVLDGHLKTGAAPYGIVSFELAGTLPIAQKIIESWGQTERIYAGLSLGIDFLFIIAYASCIGLGCVLVARSHERRSALIASIGIVLAGALWLAALLDYIENYALIKLLLGSTQAVFAVLAQWCAIPKFLLVGVGIAYVILGAVAARVTKSRSNAIL